MSSTKLITQGGQVFSYMLGMFMQVNKRIANWLLLATLLILPLIFYLKGFCRINSESLKEGTVPII
ncbi:hypothetical protein [Providencia manganoxydans]|uniref:hypothetical protein n=1 Tax=Providencia manganoxydans TaxID=2923283 RepID=UPI0034E5FBE8